MYNNLSTNTERKRSVLDAIIALLILLFAYTGLSKLIDYRQFREQLQLSTVIGKWAPFLAISLPVIELITVLLLIIPSLRRLGLYISFVLMLGFTFYVIYMLLFIPHNSLPCTCGGVFRFMSWKVHLVVNSIFTMLALVGIIINKNYIQNTSREHSAVAAAQ